MRQILFIALWFSGVAGGVSPAAAQPAVALFRPFTWEQASQEAARQNKLVMVEMGPVGGKASKAVLQDPERLNYLQQRVVAIRMEVTTPEGQAFLPRLLMYPPPYYAFFMPYGDLVGGVEAAEVGLRPDVLREALEEAWKQAEIKRKNSRAVRFADVPVEEACRQAGKQGKQVFVAVHREKCRTCLLMERNVYRLDRVADFYNAHFVNVRLDEMEVRQWVERYGVNVFPAFFYLNGDGKLLGLAAGGLTGEQLIAEGRKVLEKSAGVVFDTLSAEAATARARQENKLVFTDCRIPGNRHAEWVKKVFADPEVNDYFSAHFVNVSRVSDRNVMVFSDAQGKEVHRVAEVDGAGELLQEGQRAVEGRGTAGWTEMYRQGKRSEDFLEEYSRMLYRAGLKEQAGEVAMERLREKSPQVLKEPRYWAFFVRYVQRADPAFFDFLLAHRPELYALYGEKEVSRKISGLWMAGAENFVKEGVFDEEGFKAYAGRLKKEKVEGRKSMVRNARMHAAGQTGDWKTYVTLAEERWKEEEVSDAELYSWGIRIRQQCRDEGIRYVAARWFAERALEISRKERLSGKVSLTSYKGFFEKLVNDLTGGK